MAVGGIGLDRGMYDSNRDGRAAAVDNTQLLMERFNRGEFDLVAVGRAILNDHEWTRKLRRGESQVPFDQARLKTLY
jgi:2,4-dienoyl-CoA reductase-like NADH-dependent reductase (Old Yellow Enzyme family)